jgi:hypothetical protein
MNAYLKTIARFASVLTILSVPVYAETVITAVPYTIMRAGTYILGKSLHYTGANGTSAITVNAPNVVLDLGGFTLSGNGVTSNLQYAIDCELVENFTVQNGTITRFFGGVNVRRGERALVQNLRLFDNSTGVVITFANSCTVLNCFIVGFFPTAANTVGVYLDNFDVGIVVKNNQIANEQTGGVSAHESGSIFIANQLTNCGTGLKMDVPAKYQGNVTVQCTTPFLGGTAVGTENN